MKPGRWLTALLLAGCATPPVAKTNAPLHARIFITAELKGFLGPCGCSENMRGGIEHTAYVIAHAREGSTPVFLIDSGDALFGKLALPEEAVAQQERKAQALAAAFKLMGLQTRAVGPLDDARGPAFRKSLGLPELDPSQVQLLESGGIKLAVINAETPAQLAPRAAAARAQGARFVLGLVQQPLDVVVKAASEPLGVDFAIATRSKDEFSAENNRLVPTVTPVAQLQSKGRTVLDLELSLGDTGDTVQWVRGASEVERELEALDQRIELLRAQVNEPMLADALKALRKAKLEEVIARRAALAAAPIPAPVGTNAVSARFIPLESTSPSLPAAVALVTAYDRDVGALNLQWAKEHGKDCPAPEKGKPGYSGNESCRDCHEDAFLVYDATKHHSSYATLEKVGKNFHLDCIGCHVTGWQQPAGVCRIDRIADRGVVGCESCHGPGSVHVADPSNDNIGKGDQAKTCTGCHDAENSTHFEYDAYVAKILGPGHGQPGPEKPKPPPSKKKGSR